MLDRPCCLCGNQFDLQSVCDAARDLVLQDKKIADVAIEPLGPDMRISFSVDQLGGDAELVARPLDAAFKHIAHTQIAADLPGVDRLVSVGERGIARDY